MRQKNQLHFKECMIQRLCENSMVRNDQPGKIKSQQYCKSCTEATQISKAQKLSRQSSGPDFPATAERQNTGRDINCIRIFFDIPNEARTKQGGRNKPRRSAKAGPVVSSRDIPFVIQPKQIIEAPR
ncbi:hypothetical protein GQ457_04G022050 [Hibiscus cannabinus]